MVTVPAPPRRAAVPHITAAPDIPRLPATTRTWPNVPLCASAGRGGSGTEAVTSSVAMSGIVHVFRHSSFARDFFGGAKHAQQIPAQDFQNLVFLIAAVEQFLRDIGITRYVLELLRH